jgi:hypothetical protein
MGFKNEEKLTKWEQLKMKSKVVRKIDLDFEGETFPIEVQSVSQATLDAINEKYDDMRKPRPQQFIREAKKYIDFPEDSKEYLDWQKEQKAVESLRMAELALAFLVEKPTGNTTEEQIKELKEVLRPGDFIKVVQEGYAACGFDLDKAIEDGKNS